MDTDPDFSGSDPDFQQIQTQEKKFDPDPEKSPDPKHCTLVTPVNKMVSCLQGVTSADGDLSWVIEL